MYNFVVYAYDQAGGTVMHNFEGNLPASGNVRFQLDYNPAPGSPQPIVQVSDTLQPQVCNTITLTNTSNEKLVNVSLVDNPSNADPTTLISGGELGPGESITPIEHCYTPTATDSGTEEPEEATFSNEVLASGDGAISGSEATDGDNVQCKLCPPPQSEQLH